MHGFLGTKASLMSDVSLILETVIVAGIMVGWYLGRKHRSLQHHWLLLVTVATDAYNPNRSPETSGPCSFLMWRLRW